MTYQETNFKDTEIDWSGRIEETPKGTVLHIKLTEDIQLKPSSINKVNKFDTEQIQKLPQNNFWD